MLGRNRGGPWAAAEIGHSANNACYAYQRDSSRSFVHLSFAQKVTRGFGLSASGRTNLLPLLNAAMLAIQGTATTRHNRIKARTARFMTSITLA